MRAPEFLSVHQEVLKEGRLFGQADPLVAVWLRAPHRGAPVGPFAEQAEIAIAEIFEQGVSLAGEMGFAGIIEPASIARDAEKLSRQHRRFSRWYVRWSSPLQSAAFPGPGRFPIDRRGRIYLARALRELFRFR